MKKIKWFKLKKPKSLTTEFGGRAVTCYPTFQDALARTNSEKLKVAHICGNLTHATMFQINGTHLVSMLDAYCELRRELLPDQETHEAFLSTVCEHIAPDVKPDASKPSLIERKPPHGQAQ